MLRCEVMPTEHIIALLIAERDKLNRAIEALGGTGTKRRGRAPKNPVGAASPAAVATTPVPSKNHHMNTPRCAQGSVTEDESVLAEAEEAGEVR